MGHIAEIMIRGWWWVLQGMLVAPQTDMHGQRASKAEAADQCVVLAYTRYIQMCFILADNLSLPISFGPTTVSCYSMSMAAQSS